MEEGDFNEIELPQVDSVIFKEEKEMQQNLEVESKEEVHPETDEIILEQDDFIDEQFEDVEIDFDNLETREERKAEIECHESSEKEGNTG